MLGIVFTEFCELVEDTFGEEILDEIIGDANLPNDGAYTAVGRYDHSELLLLVAALSHRVNTPAPELVQTFGQRLFGKFVIKYPTFFSGVGDSLTFLTRIEDHIHVEVKKLYPNASLPSFQHEKILGQQLKLTYSSARPLADLAEGLMTGCAEHFGENLIIERKDLGVKVGYSTEFFLSIKE